MPYIVDVSELWNSIIGKPLVYAIMVARAGVNYEGVRQVIDSIGKSLSKFLEDPDPLIREVSQRLGISEGVVREYLLRSVKYVVDDEVIEGIDKELEVFGLPNCLSYLRLGIK